MAWIVICLGVAEGIRFFISVSNTQQNGSDGTGRDGAGRDRTGQGEMGQDGLDGLDGMAWHGMVWPWAATNDPSPAGWTR